MLEGGYKDLAVAGKGNWEKATSTKQGLFAWLGERPDALKAFTDHLAGFTVGRAKWTTLYPVEDRLLQGADSGPLIVDVGGGVGQDIQTFQELFPQRPGRLFVQDLKHVVSQANNDPAIGMQPHDFFTPQPVHGARVYLLHYVLHDWPDDAALKILGHLKDAMRQDYSKLLTVEFVVASMNADPFNTALNINIVALVGSKERTESDWRGLFQKAGLQVNGIFTMPGNHESVMEVVLA